MKPVAILFARAPRLGTVKRRLARDVGDRAALDFHRAHLTRLARALATDRCVHPVLALTPDRARPRLPVPPGRLRVVPQGQGDLGRRMARAFARFPRRRVVLFGCDIPLAGMADIRAALAALGRADAVFGPAEDGGYWLVGMGPRRPARPFAAVRWSGPHALADTRRNFAGRRVAFGRTLWDVDDVASYRRWRALDRKINTG